MPPTKSRQPQKFCQGPKRKKKPVDKTATQAVEKDLKKSIAKNLRKLAKRGQRQQKKRPAKKQNPPTKTDAGLADSSQPTEAGPEPAKTDGGTQLDASQQKERTQAAQAVAQAGGRRNCAADGPGAAYTARAKTHKLGRGAFSPSMLLPFKTRPGLAAYLSQVEILGRIGPRALGSRRVALPEQVIRWELEEPRGAAIYVGRNDARCAIVVRAQKNPLKIRLRGVPVRLVDAARRVSASIVDIEIDDKAQLTIHRRSGAKLPFIRAKLGNSGAVSATMKVQMRWGAR